MSPPLRHVCCALLLSAVVAPAVLAQAFQVDTTSSRVYIKVDPATALGHAHGVQGNLSSGKVTVGGGGELVFDMNSFVADTPQARQYVGLPAKFGGADAQKVTANMKGGDVLDVARFPTATFGIASVKPLDGAQPGGPGRYQLDGQFTLHGVTRPLSLTVAADAGPQPGTLRARGNFAVLQTSYGIQPFSALGGLVKVADQLTVWGDLVLVPSK